MTTANLTITIIYLDDYNTKHWCVVHTLIELNFYQRNYIVLDFEVE